MRERCIAATLIALATALFAPVAAEANVAPCEKAISGHGPANWRQLAIAAGPVGVFKHPLDQMSRTGNGLVAKMPILVEGHTPVTVSVPPRLRGRVFLLYGNVLDRDGNPSTSFVNTKGYEETDFEPCEGRPRTPWPGAIRIRGTAPVHLTVQDGDTFQLPLGRPRVLVAPQDRPAPKRGDPDSLGACGWGTQPRRSSAC